MPPKENFVEVEIDAPCNRSLRFRPLDANVRSRFDLARVAEPLARVKLSEFAEPLPGQRLRLDIDAGRGELIEALHLPEHAAAKERVERRGLRLAQPRQVFDGINVANWLFYLRAAARSGKARIVAGAMPSESELPGEPIRSSRPASPIERLAQAFEQLAAVLTRRAGA